MPKDRIILAGDLHLKKKPGLWSSRFEIEKDDLFGLSQICSLAREHDADLFLLGDVFDAVANLPRAIVAVKEELDVLIEQGHEVKYIQGQHEMVVANDSNVPWLRMVSGTQHMHGEKFDFFGMKAFALDYFPQSLASLAMSKVPEGTEVLFLHGSCDLVLPPEFGCHFTADMLPESVEHVFAGDFHQHIRKETPTGTHIWYTGSTYMGDITELDTKYVYMVYGINGGIKVESLPLKQRRAAKYSSFDSEEAALAFFSEDPDPALPPELHKGVLIQDVPLAIVAGVFR